MKRPAQLPAACPSTFTILAAAAVLLALLVPAAAFAQVRDEPQVFVKSVPIMQILAHPLGYKVLYVKGSMEVAEFHVPYSWIKPGGRAAVVYGSGPAYPYFSAFYVDGKFDHVKLYLVENMGHVSWGSMRRREGDSRNYEVESLELQF